LLVEEDDGSDSPLEPFGTYMLQIIQVREWWLRFILFTKQNRRKNKIIQLHR